MHTGSTRRKRQKRTENIFETNIYLTENFSQVHVRHQTTIQEAQPKLSRVNVKKRDS